MFGYAHQFDPPQKIATANNRITRRHQQVAVRTACREDANTILLVKPEAFGDNSELDVTSGNVHAGLRWCGICLPPLRQGIARLYILAV